MRLYRLLSRHGKRKRRPYPWFEPPAPEAPMKYHGWTWDPAKKEWVPDVVEPIVVTVQRPKYPKPAFPPQEALPFHVPGWLWSEMYECWERVPLRRSEIAKGWRVVRKPAYVPTAVRPAKAQGWSWDEVTEEWVATIVFGEKIGFTPPRTLPPGVDLASVFPADPYFEMSVRAAEQLVAMGRWDVLAQGDAYFKLVAQTHRLCPAAKYPHLIAQGVFEARAVMHAKRVWLSSQEAWQMRVNALDPARHDYFAAVPAVVLLGTFFALTGWLIGAILDRLITPAEETFVMPARAGTYLLGPDDWTYSRHIGTSAAGRSFYSSCMGIGTEYVRHKRGRGKGSIDIIDFPGGFLEEGYDFPHYVKFTWSYWTLQYVGMLYSCGANFYALKESDVDEIGVYPAGKLKPASEWCLDFHHYL